MSLSLPSVSICCIDTRFPELAEYSLHRSIRTAQINFGDALLFTSASKSGFRRRFDFPLKIVPIDEIASKIDYSRFVINELSAHIGTDQVLITQWDSFVLDASAWRPEFFDLDYIGAVWHWMQGPHRVGNGGFSLRSRGLMRAARETIDRIDENEDLLICRRHRLDLEGRFGLRFADESIAQRFAFERSRPDGPAFGFHGLFNFDRVMPGAELSDYVEALPEALALTIEGAELAAQLFSAGRRELGRALVRRRVLADANDAIGRNLAAQMWGPEEPCWCGSGRASKTCHARPQAPLAPSSSGDAGTSMRQTPAHEGFNADVLWMMPPQLSRVVEVGSSSGALAAAYRQSNPATEYIGIEIDAGYVEQSARHCTRVVHANIEQMSADALQALLPVDCWLFADVLEHLYDPWRVLKRLRSTMRPGDCVVACLPNTQHWSVLARLVSGNLWYEDMGLLDRTHIRFFTRITLIKMFEDSGFRIEAGRPRIFNFEHQDRVLEAIRSFARMLDMDPELCARDAMVFQHVVRAYPA
jgi:2-polyprenyl-3-methyl-5-hydroxy-6-metoxy-1,4-benzoquinol methylase